MLLNNYNILYIFSGKYFKNYIFLLLIIISYKILSVQKRNKYGLVMQEPIFVRLHLGMDCGRGTGHSLDTL